MCWRRRRCLVVAGTPLGTGAIKPMIPDVEIASQHPTVKTASLRPRTANIGRIEIHEAVASLQWARLWRCHVLAHGDAKAAWFVGMCLEQIELDRLIVELEAHLLPGITSLKAPILLTRGVTANRQ